ncbi:hypothetical protein EYC84_007732 [Monilinia fructicola]|uniref:Isopropylmalate dehydrogenase-like domain-containing protein n=1 Tax=Monilinia fructicola TaxID=38448 RepID=A0A5M9JLV8_MONFR|nr:hypothetical protein EYC84_007732 [Monilinia fructicola]
MGHWKSTPRTGNPRSPQANGHIWKPPTLQFRFSYLDPDLPLKEKVCEGVDFCIVRELTGGIYFGERKEDEGDGHAWDTEPYSREEIARVTRLAANLALAQDPPAPVWSLDKANVLATSRLWRKTVTEVMAAEFPQLKVGHHLIDSAAMLMVKDPRKLNGIVVTSNLFGDIISDEAMAFRMERAGANGIYEPIHGSAPDISGKGIVNPIGTILSVAMMLKYSLNLPVEAKAVEEAVRRTIENGVRTADIGGSNKTVEVGDAVAEELKKLSWICRVCYDKFGRIRSYIMMNMIHLKQ